jgi:hypothetical protein
LKQTFLNRDSPHNTLDEKHITPIDLVFDSNFISSFLRICIILPGIGVLDQLEVHN